MTRRWLATLIAVICLAACSTERPDESAGSTTDQAISAADTRAADDGVVDATDGAPTNQPIDVEPGPTLLTAEGWDGLRIGMTRAEVVAAAGEDANPEAVGGPEPEMCDEFRPTEAPEGLLVMIEQGILTRISVHEANGISTPTGIQVGDPGDLVLRAYGDRVIVAPHKYVDPPAGYLTVWQEDAAGERRGIRYEIGRDGQVTHIHAGSGSIEYVEGCL